MVDGSIIVNEGGSFLRLKQVLHSSVVSFATLFEFGAKKYLANTVARWWVVGCSNFECRRLRMEVKYG